MHSHTHSHEHSERGCLMNICACVCVCVFEGGVHAYDAQPPAARRRSFCCRVRRPHALPSPPPPPRARIRDRIWAHVQTTTTTTPKLLALDLWRRCSRECEIPRPSPSRVTCARRASLMHAHKWKPQRGARSWCLCPRDRVRMYVCVCELRTPSVM